jgi:hypothetical protein
MDKLRSQLVFEFEYLYILNFKRRQRRFTLFQRFDFIQSDWNFQLFNGNICVYIRFVGILQT